jgi:hypothetical protein
VSGKAYTSVTFTRGFAAAFQHCPNITRITLPANVDERTFAGGTLVWETSSGNHIRTYKAFDEAFVNFWKSQGKKGGTYVKNGPIWTLE